MELVIVLLIGLAILAAVVYANHSSAPPSSGPPRDPSIRTVQVGSRPAGITTISSQRTRPPSGLRPGIAIAHAAVAAAPSATLECGWCSRSQIECLAEGRGPVQPCRTHGCTGVNCEHCLTEHGHRCSGPCGARHR